MRLKTGGRPIAIRTSFAKFDTKLFDGGGVKLHLFNYKLRGFAIIVNYQGTFFSIFFKVVKEYFIKFEFEKGIVCLSYGRINDCQEKKKG